MCKASGRVFCHADMRSTYIWIPNFDREGALFNRLESNWRGPVPAGKSQDCNGKPTRNNTHQCCKMMKNLEMIPPAHSLGYS